MLGRVLLIIALLWSPCLLPAQNEIDSLYRKNTFVEEDTTRVIPDSIPYLATDFIHQPRYLTKGESFRTAHWWQRLFFSLSSGLYGLTDRTWQQANVPVSLSAGYEFNRYSALRLTGTFVQIPRSHTRTDLRSWGVDLDYVFNVTNYLHGFYPERYRLNFGIVPGAGMVYAFHQGERSLTWKAQLGLHLGYHFSHNTELYVEPWFGLADDKVNLSVDNPAAYDVLYGVRVGATVRLRPRNASSEPDSTNHRPFLEFSQGLFFPTDLAGQSVHNLGTAYQLSLGEWLNPAYGLRLTLTGSTFYWDAIVRDAVVTDDIQVHPRMENWQSAAYMAARLEVLLNPVNMWESGRRNRHRRKWDVNMGLGAEVGYLVKYGVPRSRGGLRKYYYGLTVAPQFLYAFSNRNWLFVEPRLTLMNYRIPYSNSDDSKAYTDKATAVSVGVRIQPPTPEERSRRRTDFTPRLWAEASWGGFRHVHPNKLLGKGRFNNAVSVGAGAELAPLVGVRLRGEYQNYGFTQAMNYVSYDFPEPARYSAYWDNTYHLLTLKLGYLLNMNTLLQGYDADRRLNVYLEAGPLVGWNLRREYSLTEGELAGGENLVLIDPYAYKTSSWGGYGGVLADFSITKRWSIHAETGMTFYTRPHFLNQTFQTPLGGWLIQLSVGAAYRMPWK